MNNLLFFLKKIMIGLKSLNYILGTEPNIKNILKSKEGYFWLDVFIDDIFSFKYLVDMLLGWKRNPPPREIIEDFANYIETNKIDIYQFLIHDYLNFYAEDTGVLDCEILSVIKMLLSFGLKIKKENLDLLKYNQDKLNDLINIIK